MQYDPLFGRINADVTFIDSVLELRRKQDQAVIAHLINRQQTALDWGQTLPAWRIVEGSISEVQPDAD